MYFQKLMLRDTSLKYKQRKFKVLKSIFVTGTAGSGKSLLTSKLNEYYTKNGVFVAVLNLDPGVSPSSLLSVLDMFNSARH